MELTLAHKLPVSRNRALVDSFLFAFVLFRYTLFPLRLMQSCCSEEASVNTLSAELAGPDQLHVGGPTCLDVRCADVLSHRDGFGS